MSVISHYFFNPLILSGLWTTIWLTLASVSLAFVVGLIFAFIYESKIRVLRWLYFAYVTLMRGVPILVQLVFIYTALPSLGVRLSIVQSSLLAFTAHDGAYMAEIIRGGIRSMPEGQWEAGRSVGMRENRILWKIILPQTARSIAPAVGNQVIVLLKSTSLVSVISMRDLFSSAQLLITGDFRVLQWFGVAAFYYLVLGGIWGIVQHFIEKNVALPTSATTPRQRAMRSQPLGQEV